VGRKKTLTAKALDTVHCIPEAPFVSVGTHA